MCDFPKYKSGNLALRGRSRGSGGPWAPVLEDSKKASMNCLNSSSVGWTGAGEGPREDSGAGEPLSTEEAPPSGASAGPGAPAGFCTSSSGPLSSSGALNSSGRLIFSRASLRRITARAAAQTGVSWEHLEPGGGTKKLKAKWFKAGGSMLCVIQPGWLKAS